MRNESCICYKVVEKKNGRFFSPIIRQDGQIMEYIIGEIIYPKIAFSKIFVFDSYENAYKFVDLFNFINKNSLSILECNAQVVKDLSISEFPHCISTLHEKENFWLKINKGLRPSGLSLLRTGTLFATWVKPTALIYG